MNATTSDLTPFVEELLFDPPLNRADFDQRTEGIDDEALVDVLVRQLREGRIDALDARAAGRFIGWLDGNEKLREHLKQGSIEVEPDPGQLVGFVALEAADTSDAPRLGLEEERYVALASAAHEEMVKVAERNPDLVEDIGRRLLRVEGESRRELLDELEAARRAEGVPAGLLYRPLLESTDDRDFVEALLEKLREAGEAADRRWLSRLASRLDSDDLASEVRDVVSALDGEPEAPVGRAFYGAPDGTGAAPLFMFIGDGRGRYVGHHLVLRHADGTIGDGYTLANVVDEEIDQMTEDFERDHPTRLTEIDVGVGVELAHRAIDGTDQRISEMKAEVRAAVHRLDRTPSGEVDVPEVDGSGDELDEGPDVVAREAFDREDWLDSWFFSPETLERVGAPEPDPEADAAAVDEWRRRTVEALSQEDAMRRRIRRTARAAARWFALDGDVRRADAFAVLAEGLDESFRDSPLVEQMVDASLEAFRELRERAEQVVEWRLGDDEVRGRLRRLHGVDEDVTGVEVAEEVLLDFMELAHHVLEEVRGEPVPGEDEPDFVSSLAGPLGKELASHFMELPAEDRPDRRTLEADLAEVLQQKGVGPRIAEFVAPDLVEEASLLATYRRR